MDIDYNERVKSNEMEECTSCAPNWMSTGWLSSPYTWFFLIFTGLIIFVSVYFSDYSSEWYYSLNKPPGLVPPYAFSIVWGVLYALIIIAIIMVAWPPNRPCIGSITFMYVAILLLMLLWILMFNQFHQLIGSAVVLVLVLILVVFFIWLIWPRNDVECKKRNWFLAYFPPIVFILLALWLVVASYYAIYFAVVN